MMRVYIASSFRQLHAVQALRELLISDGHSIIDWTVKAPPLPAGLSAQERRTFYDTDESGDLYDFCARASGAFGRGPGADVVIYFGPAGQDAACEVGMAAASGILTLGVASDLEEPGLILSRAVRFWCDNVSQLRSVLQLCAVTSANATV